MSRSILLTLAALALTIPACDSEKERRAMALTGGVPAQGKELIRHYGCASCHTTVSQVSDSVHNIGLDAVDTDVGAGRGALKAP